MFPHRIMRAVVLLIVGGLVIWLIGAILNFLSTQAGFSAIATFDTIIMTILVVGLLIWVILTFFGE